MTSMLCTMPHFSSKKCLLLLFMQITKKNWKENIKQNAIYYSDNIFGLKKFIAVIIAIANMCIF